MALMKTRNMVLQSSLLLFALTATAHSAEYWVSKQGNDSNSCASEASSCASIQKGISLAMPGDSVNIKAGVYIEDSSRSPHTAKCTWLSGNPISSLCIVRDGTKAKPIVIQAAAGDEGKVIIDSQSIRMGIHTENYDYIHIRGLTLRNNAVTGIASWGQTQNAVADPSLLGVGVLLENNAIYKTRGKWGINTAAIHMWGTKDWVVRNNRIDDVEEEGRDGNGIQSYGVINALIEHNHITNTDAGVFWKDHYVLDEKTRGFVVESEIRYNLFEVRKHGVQVSIRGAESPEAGKNHVHHNIIRGLNNGAYGIRLAMAGAYGISGPITIEHNLIDGTGTSNFIAISIDAAKEIYMAGNIILRAQNHIDLVTHSSTKQPLLVSSNYNVFDTSFKAVIDKYGKTPSISVNSLASWSALKASDAVSLGVNYPDNRSKSYPAEEIVQNIATGNYRYTAKFAAEKLMPNGTNAGPYQYGNENIGLTEVAFVAPASAGPSKPESPKATLIVN